MGQFNDLCKELQLNCEIINNKEYIEVKEVKAILLAYL